MTNDTKVYHVVYHGSRRDLVGKTALGRVDPSYGWIVQFDDIATAHGYGWHTFKRSDFTAYPDRCESECGRIPHNGDGKGNGQCL